MVNTPGYYYSFAYWIAAFIIVSTNKKRTQGKKRILIHLVALVVLVCFMEFTDGILQLLFVPSMMVTISIIFAYIYTCCDFSLSATGYYCARAFISGEFVASFGWQLYYYRILKSDLGTHRYQEWGHLLLVYLVIFAILYSIEKYIQRNSREIYISRRELFTVVMITIAVFIMSNLSYVYRNSPFSSQFAAEIFIIRTLVDLSGMSVLYAYHIQVCELQAKFELEKLRDILDMQYKSYQISQESMNLVNQKYHDLKHQITLLKSEAGNQKSVEYLEQMEREIKIYEAQNVTGNKVVDAVLTSKSIYCQNRKISLTSVVDGAALSFMEDMDVSALFGNMLDNAIESVEKLEDEKKRLIHLSVAKKNEFLRIRLENYCEESLIFHNGLPVTRKKDKQFHGFGLKSIESTAKKYGGSVTVQMKDNWFELRILIPFHKGHKV